MAENDDQLDREVRAAREIQQERKDRGRQLRAPSMGMLPRGEAPILPPEVSHPPYYNTGRIEVSSFIADKDLNFFRGNVVKYVVRAGLKDPATTIQDLQKAQWYLAAEIKRITDGATTYDYPVEDREDRVAEGPASSDRLGGSGSLRDGGPVR